MIKPALQHRVATIAILLAASLLGACSSDGDGSLNTPFTADDQAVVVATIAADYSSGAHALFDASAPFDGADEYAPGGSDVVVAARGSNFYRIERFLADHITKFDVNAPGTPIWQVSVLDPGETNANPQGLVFASESKAYLPRLASANVWVVDPSTRLPAGFKTGSLDLSAYDDGDGTPEPAGGVVVDDKLFLMLQRLDRTASPWDPQTAYLAVFDVATGAEIDTGVGGAFKGVPLQVRNPQSISYDADSGMIYVVASGRYAAFSGSTPTEYTGGIEAIDPDDYSTDLILDDGDATTHPIGQFTHMAIVSASKGYVVGYAGWQNNGLYEFNPITGTLLSDASGNPLPVAGISGVEIAAIGLDGEDKLWVSLPDSSEPGLRVIDSDDNSVVKQRVATTLNPGNIAFVDAPD